MQSQSSMFQACFVYTDEILSDFEKLYHLKGSLSPVARIICGVLGVAGAIYFGFQLYRHGFQIATADYLIVCSLMILVAVSSRRRSGTDDTLKKYRKYYENHRATFRMDADGVDMKLEGQKNHAHSKFRQIYSLFETERCFYFVIKGKAYYILPKKALSQEDADALRTYMQQQCKKKFQFYAL